MSILTRRTDGNDEKCEKMLYDVIGAATYCKKCDWPKDRCVKCVYNINDYRLVDMFKYIQRILYAEKENDDL